MSGNNKTAAEVGALNVCLQHEGRQFALDSFGPRQDYTAPSCSSELVAQVRETVDLVICRSQRGDEARQDLVGAEVEARACPLIISGASSFESRVERTRQNDKDKISLYWPNRRQPCRCELARQSISHEVGVAR